jgi:hypothetical protein
MGIDEGSNGGLIQIGPRAAILGISLARYQRLTALQIAFACGWPMSSRLPLHFASSPRRVGQFGGRPHQHLKPCTSPSGRQARRFSESSLCRALAIGSQGGRTPHRRPASTTRQPRNRRFRPTQLPPKFALVVLDSLNSSVVKSRSAVGEGRSRPRGMHPIRTSTLWPVSKRSGVPSTGERTKDSIAYRHSTPETAHPFTHPRSLIRHPHLHENWM